MKLLAIAYPVISESDFDLIENFRKENDVLYKVVRPHFTLVFPVDDFSSDDFIIEIKKPLKYVKSISFCIRKAIIHKDDFTDYYHTFLIPDEGFNEIDELNKKLYSDKLKPHHRIDLDFIPHITIGSSKEKKVCKRMVYEWNKKNVSIEGVISTIDIVSYENEIVTTVEKIKLSANPHFL